MCRFSEGGAVYRHEDRRSSLPDEVRCHILSFLPTQNSVATSVLSKNWRYLWRFVPSVHLDKYRIRIAQAGMEDIVNKLLLYPEPETRPINDVYLHTGGAGNLPVVNSWLQAAITRQVRTLDICFPVSLTAGTILSLCSSSTLEVLKLQGEFNFRDAPPGASFSFPRLKVLHLVTRSTDPEAMHTLFTACPELQELVLEGRLTTSDKRNFEISAPTLKRLSLNFRGLSPRTRKERRIVFPFDIRFNITAPALEFLFLIGPDLIYKLGVQPMLKTAMVDVDSSTCYHNNTTSFVEFLNAMSNVNSLCLCPRTMRVLDYVSVGSFPEFPKLTRLEVQLLDGSDWNTMINLLKGFIKLEVFVLMKEDFDFRGCGLDPSNSLTTIYVPRFAVKLVKVIEILGFKGRHDEQELTSYLLKHINIQDHIKIKSSQM